MKEGKIQTVALECNTVVQSYQLMYLIRYKFLFMYILIAGAALSRNIDEGFSLNNSLH